MLISMILAISLCTGAEAQAAEALERFREALRSKPQAERAAALETAVDARLNWLSCMEMELHQEHESLRARGAAQSALGPTAKALRELESEIDLHRRAVTIVRILWMNRFRAEEQMQRSERASTGDKR